MLFDDAGRVNGALTVRCDDDGPTLIPMGHVIQKCLLYVVVGGVEGGFFIVFVRCQENRIMGLTVPGCVDFSGGIEGGGLESHWTFVDNFVERCIAQILIPKEFGFRLLGISGGVNEKHVGWGIGLVVFQASRTIIGRVFFAR